MLPRKAALGGTQNRVTFSEFGPFTGQVGTDLQGQDTPLHHSLPVTCRQARLSSGTLALEQNTLQEPEFTNSRAKRAQEEKENQPHSWWSPSKDGKQAWDPANPMKEHGVLSTSGLLLWGRQYQLRLPGSSLETRNPHFGRNTLLLSC